MPTAVFPGERIHPRSLRHVRHPQALPPHYRLHRLRRLEVSASTASMAQDITVGHVERQALLMRLLVQCLICCKVQSVVIFMSYCTEKKKLRQCRLYFLQSERSIS